MSIRLPEDNGSLIINLQNFASKRKTESDSYLLGKVGMAIPYSPELGNAFHSFLQNCERPYRSFISLIPFQDPFRSELARFMIALDAYYESSRPVMSIEFLLDANCQRSDSGDFLKKVRRRSILHTMDGIPLEPDEDLRDIPYFHFQDIGDIFNYNYAIHWEQCDPQDYLYGNEPLSLDKATVTKFRRVCRALLETVDLVDEIDPREILYGISGSKSLDPVTFKTDFNWKLKSGKNRFAESIGTCKRTVIDIGPANIRDTVILSIDSLNRVKLIEQQTQRIIEQFDTSFQLRDPEEIERKLNKLKDFKYFLMRDITKEGITKPRELLKVMLEELHSRFPTLEAYRYPDFYSDFSIIVNDEEFRPIRGHGLGMANALTTLMQITIYHLVLEMTDNENYALEGESYALALNDDFVVGFESEQDYESYNYNEDLVFPLLGLLRSKKKSFLADNNYIIAERYYNNNFDYDRKESYHRKEILNCFTCHNIVQAKQLISSTVTMRNIDIAEEYMEELVSFWGYEFFPEEINYPAFCGGWFSLSICGVSIDLLSLSKLPYNNKVFRAYQACKYNTIKIRRNDKSPYVPPIIKGLKPFVIPKELESILNLATYGDVYSKFLRTSNLPNSPKIWASLMNKRDKTFRKTKDLLSWEDFLELIVKDYPTKSFYPCDDMIDSYATGYYREGFIKDIYLSCNPLIASLSKYNDFIPFKDLKEDFSVHFTKKDSITRSMNSDIRQRLKGSLFNIGREDFTIPLLYGIFESENWLDISDSYLNHHGVSRIASMITVKGVPILKNRFRSPLIDKKREVFSRFLSNNEVLLLQNMRRTLIKDIIVFSDTNDIPIEWIVEELEKFFPTHIKEEPPEEEDPFEGYFIEEEEENARNATLDDFWTWRTEPYPVVQPFKRIFNGADALIAVDSMKRTSITRQGDWESYGSQDYRVSDDSLRERTIFMYPGMDIREIADVITLYRKWSEYDVFNELEGSDDGGAFGDLFG